MLSLAVIVGLLLSCSLLVVLPMTIGSGAPLQFAEVVVEAIEAFFPKIPVALCPVGDLLERLRREVARAPLGAAAALDEVRPLEHLEVLGDGGQAHVERCREGGDGGLAVGQCGEDRAAGRIGEGGEGCAERVADGVGSRHDYSPFR